MRIPKFMFYAILFAGISSCGTKTNADRATESMTEKTSVDNTGDKELITAVYDKFVFAIDSDGINTPEEYFTANALKKLQEDYEFDCEDGPCYAYYALRTEAQDSKPGTEDVSQICSIEPAENGWYIVSYSDMGWNGKTRIKIVDGKIDTYERLEQ
ncbi:MAG: hypothetical protein K2H47_10875 [Muribaculaceae bacterium]|nr:hypothetical protein [Muribaculaceae bacterium]